MNATVRSPGAQKLVNPARSYWLKAGQSVGCLMMSIKPAHLAVARHCKGILQHARWPACARHIPKYRNCGVTWQIRVAKKHITEEPSNILRETLRKTLSLAGERQGAAPRLWSPRVKSPELFNSLGAKRLVLFWSQSDHSLSPKTKTMDAKGLELRYRS